MIKGESKQSEMSVEQDSQWKYNILRVNFTAAVGASSFPLIKA